MRKYLFFAAAVALGLAAAGLPAQAQMMGGYGGGYGPGYGMGYGMMGGYGGNGSYGHGPGMMYGYGGGYMHGYGYRRGYHRGQTYRGKQLCWHRTGANNTGYYGACR